MGPDRDALMLSAVWVCGEGSRMVCMVVVDEASIPYNYSTVL